MTTTRRPLIVLITAHHYKMEEPTPERSLPSPSPQPSRELLEGSWGLDLTPERDIKPRKRLREPTKTKASRELKNHEGDVFITNERETN